jgi:hypothetical protein
MCKEVRDLRDPSNNIQSLWAKFKMDVTTYGKHCSRYITNEAIRLIPTWRAQLKIVVHDCDMPQEDRSAAAYLLERKIRDRLKEDSEKKGLYQKRAMMLKAKLWPSPVRAPSI